MTFTAGPIRRLEQEGLTAAQVVAILKELPQYKHVQFGNNQGGRPAIAALMSFVDEKNVCPVCDGAGVVAGTLCTNTQPSS